MRNGFIGALVLFFGIAALPCGAQINVASAWEHRVRVTSSQQPGWAVPIFTPSSGLVQLIRFDGTRQYTPTHTTTWNIDGGKGFDFIPWYHSRRVRECVIFAAPFVGPHQLDLDGIFGTRGDTCRALAVRQAAVTHVAFADDAAFGVVLGHTVRAVPGAVLATDACISAMADDAGQVVLCVRVYRTAGHARGLEAVIAADGEVMTVC